MGINTTTNLPEETRQLTSAEMLIKPEFPILFFNNGPIQVADPEFQQPGATSVLFNRPVLPAGTYTEVSRRLTQGTRIPTTAQALTMTQATLTLREYAGPVDAGGTLAPFGLSEFLSKHSIHQLPAYLGQMLGRDRWLCQDTWTRDMLLSATNVVTPNGAAEGVITAGQVATVAWIRKLRKKMIDLAIPTFDNGRWRLIINTTDEANLKSDAEYREATRYLAGTNPLFTGHVASFEGFDIMVSERLPTKAVGAGEAVTAQQSVAFGKYGIGWGMPMPPEARQADDTDFGRELLMIWISHEALDVLYPDLLVRGITT